MPITARTQGIGEVCSRPLADKAHGLQSKIAVSYRTVLRMRDIIKKAAGKYRGHKYVFGAWPRSFMLHQREKHEETIRATGVLAAALPPRTCTQSELNRTERLLRLLLATQKTKRHVQSGSLRGSSEKARGSRPLT